MANLKETRNRIASVKNTQKITSAMKMVAAAKMRRAQESLNGADKYFGHINSILSRIIGQGDEVKSKFLKENKQNDSTEKLQHEVIVLLTSDRGLCGGFNAQIIKKTIRYIEGCNHKVSLVCLGEKGYSSLKRKDFNIYKNHKKFYDRLNNASVEDAAKELSNIFIGNEKNLKGIDKISIAYNKFKNVLTQEPLIETLLPIDDSTIDKEAKEEIGSSFDYIYEPKKPQLLPVFLELYVKQRLYFLLLQSLTGEMGARMTAMDNATNNAGDVINSLTLLYNRLRQSAITNELIEIVNGAQAL